VRNAVAPADPVTAAQLRRDLESSRRTLLLLALLDGETAGCGIAAASSVPDAAFAVARVLPAFRRRGAGSALYAALSEHARDLGVQLVWTRVAEDDRDGLEFVAHRGFVEVGRECQSRLRLAGATGLAGPPPDVDVVSLAGRPELAPHVHALAVEASRDIPTAEEFRVPPLDEWRRDNVDAALLEGSFVALAGERVVGYAGLTDVPAAPGLAEHLLTAVAAGWRRRGVARALKSAQIEWARRHGFHELVTYNEAANEPMRRLNADLGYRRLPDDLRYRRPLAGADR
jgi:GNAT superfamily N-acetyltransferase